MKRQLLIACLAALCASTVLSCNKDAEEDYLVDPLQDREVLLTASLADGPDTRAVSVSGDAVSCSWNVDDKLALVYGGEIISELTVSSISGNRAALSGKVKGAYPEGTEFTLYYGGTDYNYASQSGTQADASRRAYLSSTATIARQDNKTLQLGPVSLGHRQAYFELSFQYGPDLLKVKKVEVTGSDRLVKRRPLAGNPEYFTAAEPFTVTAASDQGADIMYFALCDESTADVTYVFKVTDINGVTYEKEYKIDGLTVSNPYLYKTGTAQNGSYHSGNWVLDQKSAVSEAPVAIQTTVYDGNAHALVTPGRLPEGTVGAVIEYYTAPRLPLSATPGIYTVTDVGQLQPDAGSTWSTTVPEGTDPGEYYIWYRVRGGLYFKNDPEDAEAFVIGKQVESNPARILRRTLAVTAPAAVANLKYTGSSQALVTAGSLKDELNGSLTDCVLQYYVDSVAIGASAPAAPAATATGWSTEVPRGISAKDYYVWYKVDGGDYYYEVAVTPVSSVAIRIVTTDAVVANPVPIENLVYNGEEQQLVLPADASDGCKVYYHVHESDVDRSVIEAMNASDDWSEDVPMRKNAGTYYIWTKIVEEGHTNYSGVPGVSAAAVVTGIGQTSVSVVNAPEKVENWTYDGVNHDLVKAIEYAARPNRREVFAYAGPSGQRDPFDVTEEEYPATLQFRINTGEWVSINNTTPDYSVVAAKNAGTYSIQYRVVGSKNFKDYPGSGTGYVGMGSVVVAKASINVTVPDVIDDWTVYDNAEHTLLKDSPATAVTYAGANNTDALSATAEAPNPAVLYYRVNSGEWVAYNPENPNLPKATNAGTYQVWYKVEGGINFASKTATSIGSFTVAKVNPTITPAPAAKTDLVYNGEPLGLLAADNYSTNYGTLQFGVSMTNSVTGVTWGSELPTGQNAGTYYPFYRVVGNENISDLGPVCFIVTIARATLSSFAVDIEGWNYGDPANAPSVSGNTGGGAVTYSYKVQGADDNTYSGTAPTAPGDYTVRAIAAQTTNYESATATKNFTIGQATGTLTLSSSTVYLAAGGAQGAIYAISNDTGASFSAEIDDNTKATVAFDPNDASKLIITPVALGEATITVTMTPSNTTNYTTPAPATCSVTMVTAPVGAPASKPGVFSVSDTKRVFFSKGNLQATTTDNGANWTWSFAENQWGIVYTQNDSNVSYNGTVGLFAWSTTNNNYGIGSSGGDTFRDWGDNAISNGGNVAGYWSTMSGNEIGWLVGTAVVLHPGDNCRKTNPVNGTSNALFTMAKINTNSTNNKGIIFFPDNYAGPTVNDDTIQWGDINEVSDFTTLCTSEGWSTLEQYGCVFLPAAGQINKNIVNLIGSYIQYWARDAADSTTAHELYCKKSSGPSIGSAGKGLGLAVRLIAPIIASSDNSSIQDYNVQPGQTW